MYQYYIGKKEASLKLLELNTLIENRLFYNDGLENKDKYKYSGIKANRCTFSRISFNKIDMAMSKFMHCVFVDCYLKSSELRHIEFRNCIFINCQFSDVKIKSCDFFYTEWDNTVIKFDELYDSLPKIHNNRSRLCKVMAKNFLEDGNIAEYRKYFFESIRAREKHYKEIILRRESFYSEEYNIFDSLKYTPKLIVSKINGIAWNHGESVRKIVFSSSIIVIIFATLYSINKEMAIEGIQKYSTALYISLCNFLTLSCDITFSDVVFRTLTILEGFTGIIFAGLFVTALVKKINMR